MIYRHIPNLTIKSHFSSDHRHRYWLEMRRPGIKGGKTVCAVMQNPSYASETVADRSVQFLEKLVFDKGLPEFEGVAKLVVVNQYALIQTKGFASDSPAEIRENDVYLRKALSEADIVLLAWGKTNTFKDRQAAILDMLHELPGKVVYETRKHPSRGSYEDFLLLRPRFCR